MAKQNKILLNLTNPIYLRLCATFHFKHALNKKSMSMTESKFLYHAVLLCVGVQVLKFWLGRFHQILDQCECIAVVIYGGCYPSPRWARRRNHLA